MLTPNPNPETSYYEIRKRQELRDGSLRYFEPRFHVQGQSRAKAECVRLDRSLASGETTKRFAYTYRLATRKAARAWMAAQRPTKKSSRIRRRMPKRNSRRR